jgi:hypothetical protein
MTEKAHRIGDLVHNNFTQEQGRVVRIYSDLDQPSKSRRKKLSYIVILTSATNGTTREVLWPDADVSDRTKPA